MKNNCYPSPFQLHLFYSLEDSLVTPEWYKIRHSYSGLCVAVGSYYDLLVLTNCQAASTWFQYSYQDYKLTDDKRRCILPIQLSDHHYYLQANNYCPDPSNSRYRQTVGKSMQHINSRKCFHPRDSPPIVGTSIILNPTCDTKWTEFILSSKYVQHKCFVSVDDSAKGGG